MHSNVTNEGNFIEPCFALEARVRLKQHLFIFYSRTIVGMSKKTLLAIFAHPDDEVFGNGGTLTRYAKEGVDVYLICSTRGESGKITDPSIDPNVDKGVLREQELKDACAAMGINPPILLDYQDSGRQDRVQHGNDKALMNVDEFVIEQELLKHIARIKPDVILGFDPHGIYGHIDHVKMHRATIAAFWSADSVMTPAPKRLFFSAISSERMLKMQEARPQSPLASLDAGIYGVAEASFAAIMDISAFAAEKEAAIKAHRSQVGPQSSFANATQEVKDEAWQEMFGRETFTLGGLRGSFPEMPVDDFFEGL